MNPHKATCPGVPIFCPLCEQDVGPIFPSIGSDRPYPKVVHHNNGTHTFDWEIGGTDG